MKSAILCVSMFGNTEQIAREVADARAARILRTHGFEVLDRPTSFYVADLKGPVEPGELARAREWGAHLLELVDGHRARDAS